jgi:hypothetical protein
MFHACPVNMSSTAPSSSPSWVCGQSDQHEHDTGKETQYRNGLQNVEQGNHHTFGLRPISSDVPIHQRKSEAQQIRGSDAEDGIGRVCGQCPWTRRYLRFGHERRHRYRNDVHQTVDPGDNSPKYEKINRPGPGPERWKSFEKWKSQHEFPEWSG